MIINAEPKLSILEHLRTNTEFDFYLTGSRFFGAARVDSDWDFFTEDTLKVRSWLSALGFRAERVQAYPHTCILNDVVVHKVENIHVQLVSDVKIKNRIQETMKEVGLNPCLYNKEDAKRIWRLCETLAN